MEDQPCSASRNGENQENVEKPPKGESEEDVSRQDPGLSANECAGSEGSNTVSNDLTQESDAVIPEVEEHILAPELDEMFLNLCSGKAGEPELSIQLGDGIRSVDEASASREPGIARDGSSSEATTQESSPSNVSQLVSVLPNFDDVLNSVAGNLMKHLRRDPPNFLEDLVESLGSNTSYSPGESEEIREERLRMNETQRMLKELTADPDLMQQVMRAASNPEMAKELARQADTAWRNIEALPGGFRALYQMHRNIQQPLWQAVTAGGETTSTSTSRYAKPPAPKPTQPLTVEPLPNPWATPSTSFSPHDGISPLSLRSIMHGFRSSDNERVIPPSPFLRPLPINQETHSSVSQSPLGSLTIGQSNPSNSAFADVPRSEVSVRPAVAEEVTEATEVPAPNESSDVSSDDRYANELRELSEMGMVDRDRCLTALEASDGDLFQALDLLQHLDEMDKPDRDPKD